MKPDFKGFADDIISNRFEGDLDGFDMQDLGIKYELLEIKIINEPCCDTCRCKEYDGEFPVECYRKTYE